MAWRKEFAEHISEDLRLLRQRNAELRACLAACVAWMEIEDEEEAQVVGKAEALIREGDPLS